MSDLINIYSISKKKTKRESIRYASYQTILKRCHKKIITESESISNNCFIFYEIPSIIFGLPPYDMKSCNDYLVNKLKSNGFKVLNITDNFIFISWKHITFSEDDEKIMQDKIDLLNGDVNVVPVSSQLLKLNPKNEFRPIHEVPNTEKFLLN